MGGEVMIMGMMKPQNDSKRNNISMVTVLDLGSLKSRVMASRYRCAGQKTIVDITNFLIFRFWLCQCRDSIEYRRYGVTLRM